MNEEKIAPELSEAELELVNGGAEALAVGTATAIGGTANALSKGKGG